MQQTLLREIEKINEKNTNVDQSGETPQHVSSSFSNRPLEFSLRTTLDPMKESMDEFRLSVKKVELPELPGFSGFDPLGWISRAETYFEVHNTDNNMKIKLSRLCMEGCTIHWFNIWRKSDENLTWGSLKQALMLRFGGMRYDNPFEALKILQQSRTME